MSCCGALLIQQPLFQCCAPVEPARPAIGAGDPVAGHKDCQAVFAHRLANGPGLATQLLGDFTIVPGATGGNT